MDKDTFRFVIITGMSGAGKTNFMQKLEDMGYYCVDNLPPVLIVRFADLCWKSTSSTRHVAVVTDIRGGSFFDALPQALDELEKECDIPIMGVVKPGAKAAVEATRNGKIGVIATEATIGSGIYSHYIKELKSSATIYGKACPLFVPLVEEGLWEDPVTEEIARRYLAELIDNDIDTLILGCTHYPLIRSTVRKVIGEQVTLVNPAYETAIELRRVLADNGLLREAAPKLGENQYQFYVSDMAEKFKVFANSIIKYGILSAKTVNIEDY